VHHYKDIKAQKFNEYVKKNARLGNQAGSLHGANNLGMAF
jgi:hypothetical protein